MRFRKYLERNKYPPYESRYLDFNLLYSLIKPNLTQEEESNFRKTFESQFNDVFSFVQFKYEDLQANLNSIEAYIQEKRGASDLEILQEELYAFAEFIRVNIEGFKIIIQKHDKKSGFSINSLYKKIFDKKLEDIEDLNRIIYNVSRLKLKTIKIGESKENNLCFVRKTTKYWVHPENLYALKLKIVKNLPIYVFNGEPKPNATPYSGWDPRLHDTCVSSVYLDNVDFELYKERIFKNQGSEAIRIRWYGEKIPKTVFIERKKHQDKWTGFSSMKLRFKIDEKYVVDFLNGKNVWEHVKLLNGSDVFDLYKEIQTAIVTKKLRPIVRTFYKRTAFQLPNDSTVRLSLDTNLVMIKECSDEEFEKNEFPLERWRREDAECEWPFKNLKKSEIVRFPYAVLEVKTQGVDDTKPQWIQEITNSSYVENVHKYSKFMHGCAVLYRSIDVIPYWLPQMATDIRKDSFRHIKEAKTMINNRLVSAEGEPENLESADLSPIDDHGKRIAMPIRVEPKVFFANERTFLKWVQFSIFLGGLGTAILGLGEHESVWCGSILMAVSVLFILYALYIYIWRIEKIRIRFPGPYDDLVGPTVLVGIFMIALLASIFFKFPRILENLEENSGKEGNNEVN